MGIETITTTRITCDNCSRHINLVEAVPEDFEITVKNPKNPKTRSLYVAIKTEVLAPYASSDFKAVICWSCFEAAVIERGLQEGNKRGAKVP